MVVISISGSCLSALVLEPCPELLPVSEAEQSQFGHFPTIVSSCCPSSLPAASISAERSRYSDPNTASAVPTIGAH